MFVCQVSILAKQDKNSCLVVSPAQYSGNRCAVGDVTFAAMMSAGGVRASFHVGDTPADMQAAIAANSIAIGVTTGVFTREQLLASGADAAPGQVVVLDSLEDIEKVLKVLRLE